MAIVQTDHQSNVFLCQFITFAWCQIEYLAIFHVVAIGFIEDFIVNYLTPEFRVEIETDFNVLSLFYADLVVVVN